MSEARVSIDEWKKRQADAEAQKAALAAEAAAIEAEALRIAAAKKLSEAKAPADPSKAATAEVLASAKTAKDLAEAQKAALAAETATIEAEALRIAAAKKLSEAKAPADPSKAATAEVLASAKTAKDLADAKKAQSDAELAAFKAQIGEMPSSGIQGSVELGEKAGSMETALLAAMAMATASEKVATAITQLQPPPATVFVFPSGESPDLKALRDFRALRQLLTPEFVQALKNLNVASKEELPMAAAGIALDAVTKLLGFFRSDFKVGGTELTADHVLLAESIAGQLRKKLPRTRIHLQSLYYKYNPATERDFLDKEFKPLSDQHKTALDELRTAETLAAALTVDLAKITGDTQADQEKKVPLRNRINRIETAIERLKKVISVYDATVEKLATEGKFETLTRQYEISTKLSEDNAYVLTAKVHKVGGSHYVVKNLWTTFGAMPYKVMGGVIISYSLFEAKTGSVVLSDMVPVHGGFKNANKVGTLLGNSK